MKKTWIYIGVAIAAVFFVLVLLLGGSTPQVVKQEDLEVVLKSVTCSSKNETDVTYNIDKLTNDVSFDTEIQNKNYTKIVINKEKGFKFFGLSFLVKADEELTLDVALTKNGEEIKTINTTILSGNTGTINLAVEESFEVGKDDELAITFSQTTELNFRFDTMLFFFDED